MATITFTWDASTSGYYFKSPFHEEFKDEFKYEVPPSKRRWDPVDKQWWVHSDFIDEATKLADKFFGGHMFVGVGHNAGQRHTQDQKRQQWQHTYSGNTSNRPPWDEPRQQTSTGDPAYLVLFVLPNAPFEVCKAAYRALAQMYHPEAQHPLASEEKMIALNNAYDRIKQLTGRQ